uniref:Uncharacterized protein n=1 Tax=Fagus sylvatica TaxID=28930 RepID=A0A2N9HNL1_FAGSY
MVRAPCCEKMGMKKGPWTPEEDQILINYIQLYGHGNWRALPKQAGLLRCGKSCRLRWTNYLRPDIKRGNFSREEEDTIIKLHEMLGNRAVSPQECSSDMSTVTMGDNGDNNVFPKVESPRNFLETDESFWAEVLSTENSGVVSDFSAVDGDPQLQFQLSPLMNMDPVHAYGSNMHDSMDFWFNLFTRAGELPELPDV